MRTAMIAMILANVNRGKGHRAYKIEDFMPAEPKLRKRKQTVEEQKEAIMRIVAMAKRTGILREKERK